MEVRIACSGWKNGKWEELKEKKEGETLHFESGDGRLKALLTPAEYGWDYVMESRSEEETQIRLSVSFGGGQDAFHVIPCNIYGDNNIDRVKPGEFPSLTRAHTGTRFCSPFWEFRADRAAMPVSMMSLGTWTAGISVDPYSEKGGEAGWIHNGVFAALPDTIGVSLGYENFPSTFVDKGHEEPATAEYARHAKAKGSIYLLEGKGRQDMHRIVQLEYEKRHESAHYE